MTNFQTADETISLRNTGSLSHQTIASGNTFGGNVNFEHNVNSELFLFKYLTIKLDRVIDHVTLSVHFTVTNPTHNDIGGEFSRLCLLSMKLFLSNVYFMTELINVMFVFHCRGDGSEIE